jgi:hypothetical protein
MGTLYTHVGLINGTTYNYRVCAIDRAGNISTGITRSARPLPEFNPPTGTIMINNDAAYTRNTTVTLTLNATDASGVSHMCISNTGTCTAWGPYAAARSWILTAGDGMKTVNVWFRDRWGNANPTPYSDQILLDTKAPVNGTLTPVPGDRHVVLNWPGFTDAGTGIAGYKLVFSAVSAPTTCSTGTVLYNGTDTTYTHTNLTNGTTYFYRVCAIDGLALTSTGAGAKGRPLPEFDPPTGEITINGGAEFTKSATVTLAITASDASGAVQMCTSNTATCTAWTAYASTKTWVLTRGNGQRTVNVWFRDVWGTANPTPYNDRITLDTQVPVNGTVTTTPGDTQIELNWGGYTDAGSGIAYYRVVYSTTGTPLSCKAGTIAGTFDGLTLTYTHKGLVNGTRYYYRVCAIDKLGYMSSGAAGSARPLP